MQSPKNEDCYSYSGKIKGGRLMTYQSPLLVVKDINKSREFYCKLFGLEVIMDFGANITLTGGISFQTLDSWAEFINREEKDIAFGGNDAELYFEEEAFDDFVEKLKKFENIEYVHGVKEFPWGQRVIRFYDPDRHILEVGEKMETVCKRFLDSGMTVEETSKRTMLPIEFVRTCL